MALEVSAMWKKYRNMACMGIVGAALFGVGDWMIYLYPGLNSKMISSHYGRKCRLGDLQDLHGAESSAVLS